MLNPNTFMLKLQTLEVEILGDLFDVQGSAKDVDAARFRLRHEVNFRLIDQLVNVGLIRESMGRYRLTIFGLEQIPIPLARTLLAQTNPLYNELQTHYRSAVDEPISIEEIALRAKVDLSLAKVAIPFMNDIPWCAGWGSGFPDEPGATVCVSEKILEHINFSDALTATAKWFLRPVAPITEVTLPTFTESVKVLSLKKPAWHSDLLPPLPSILKEIYESRNAGHITLPILGIRTILDLVCSSLTGETGSFQAKLTLAKKQGYMTESECEIFSVAFDAGSAAAHRGYVSDAASRDELLEIMEHILKSKFRIDLLAEKIKADTPKRKR